MLLARGAAKIIFLESDTIAIRFNFRFKDILLTNSKQILFHRDLQFAWRLLKYGVREKQTQLVKEYAVICIFYSEMTNLRKH